MENSYKSAFAFTDGEGRPVIGLTKREYFAGLAMQGMLTNGYIKLDLAGGCKSSDSEFTNVDLVVKMSLACADELLKQLENN